jgi:hypothetical protein
MQIVKQTWELIAMLGGRSLTTLNWRALFWIPVRFAQCDWLHSLCYLTVLASYLCSAGSIYETQHNFDLQQTTVFVARDSYLRAKRKYFQRLFKTW